MTTPELADGYARLVVTPTNESDLTPGAAARAVGIDLDAVGAIHVSAQQIVVDVLLADVLRARDGLQQLGPVKIVKTAPIEQTWAWFKLHVGRNHGLTMGLLRKLFNRAQLTELGRIEIRNTCAYVGLTTEALENAIAHFADAKVNGITVRPCRAPAGEMRGDPAFHPAGKRP